MSKTLKRIITVACLVVLLAALVLKLTAESEINTIYSGFELSLDDEGYARACDVYVTGTYTRKLFDSDVFKGEIILPEPYRAPLEDAFLSEVFIDPGRHSVLWYNEVVNYRYVTHHPGDIYIRGRFDDFIILLNEQPEEDEQPHHNTISGKLIVAPAETEEEARRIFSEYYEDEEQEWLRIRVDSYRRNAGVE